MPTVINIIISVESDKRNYDVGEEGGHGGNGKNAREDGEPAWTVSTPCLLEDE